MWTLLVVSDDVCSHNPPLPSRHHDVLIDQSQREVCLSGYIHLNNGRCLSVWTRHIFSSVLTWPQWRRHFSWDSQITVGYTPAHGPSSSAAFHVMFVRPQRQITPISRIPSGALSSHAMWVPLSCQGPIKHRWPNMSLRRSGDNVSTWSISHLCQAWWVDVLIALTLQLLSNGVLTSESRSLWSG